MFSSQDIPGGGIDQSPDQGPPAEWHVPEDGESRPLSSVGGGTRTESCDQVEIPSVEGYNQLYVHTGLQDRGSHGRSKEQWHPCTTQVTNNIWTCFRCVTSTLFCFFFLCGSDGGRQRPAGLQEDSESNSGHRGITLLHQESAGDPGSDITLLLLQETCPKSYYDSQTNTSRTTFSNIFWLCLNWLSSLKELKLNKNELLVQFELLPCGWIEWNNPVMFALSAAEQQLYPSVFSESVPLQTPGSERCTAEFTIFQKSRGLFTQRDKCSLVDLEWNTTHGNSSYRENNQTILSRVSLMFFQIHPCFVFL